jgi:zona occludens toxin
MAIYLTTGTPGAGKTLWTLWTVEQRRIADNKEFYDKWVAAGSDLEIPPLVRDVYYFNINIKNLPWIRLHKPEDWLDAPKGSLFVFDECQEAFPPRANASTPPKYVAELAKARHGGYDLYFVTQHPTFVDPYIRKLAEEHNHLMRPFGAKRAVVHTWKGVKDQCDKSRTGSLTSQFTHPKEVYSWYKSAEIHTHKFKLPTKLKMLLLVPVLLGACIYFAVGYFQKKLAPPPSSPAPGKVLPGGQSASMYGIEKPPFDPASYKPRFVDVPWSAPRYDDLTKPTIAPRIVGCMIFKKSCKCVTQQGTYHLASMNFCQVTIQNGIFQDFEDGGGRSAVSTSKNDFQQPEKKQEISKPEYSLQKIASLDSGFNLPVSDAVSRYHDGYTTQQSGDIYYRKLQSGGVMYRGN